MTSKRVGLAALVVMTMAATAACAGESPAPAGPMVLRADGVSRLQPPADAPVAAVVAGLARFGFNLAPTSPAQNWVASPASIAYALAMTRAGAGGTTAAEIDKAFGFPAAGLHEAFNALSRQIVTAPLPPPPTHATRDPGSPPAPTTVCIGNALFPAKGFDIRPAYLRTLAEQYDTGVYPVDYHQPSALESIDAWARQQTADRIRKVFDSLDPDTALVLANTVYLKGDWAEPFEKSATGDADFRRADGSVVRAKTMHNSASLDYAEGDGWQAVQLPYGDGAFAMRILVPTATLTPHDLLAPGIQAAVSSKLATEPIDLALPVWDFSAEVALKPELIRLGVTSMFDPSSADLSGMSPVKLFVAQAVHRATISVDEFGTEAAAVTALAVMPTSAMGPERAVKVDRAFAFAIVHVATGTPLFIGQVADPTTH